MNNISKQLNDQLRELVTEKMRDNLVSILKEQPNRTLCLDDKDRDRIYGYYYDESGDLVEKQVKGVALGKEDDDVYVYLDDYFIQFTAEDLNDDKKAVEENWYNLFYDEVLGWFTMMNINESLHEYL